MSNKTPHKTSHLCGMEILFSYEVQLDALGEHLRMVNEFLDYLFPGSTTAPIGSTIDFPFPSSTLKVDVSRREEI